MVGLVHPIQLFLFFKGRCHSNQLKSKNRRFSRTNLSLLCCTAIRKQIAISQFRFQTVQYTAPVEYMLNGQRRHECRRGMALAKTRRTHTQARSPDSRARILEQTTSSGGQNARGVHVANYTPLVRLASWPCNYTHTHTRLSLIHISEPTRPY